MTVLGPIATLARADTPLGVVQLGVLFRGAAKAAGRFRIVLIVGVGYTTRTLAAALVLILSPAFVRRAAGGRTCGRLIGFALPFTAALRSLRPMGPSTCH